MHNNPNDKWWWREDLGIYIPWSYVFLSRIYKEKKTVLLASYVLHIQAHKNVPEQQSFTVVASGEMILLC